MEVIKREDDPGISAEASLALSAFRVAVDAEQRTSLAAGVPYPLGNADGAVTWVHPDGTRRSGFASDAEIVD